MNPVHNFAEFLQKSLTEAAHNPNPQMARITLKNKISTYITQTGIGVGYPITQKGDTALHLVINAGYTNCCSLLLEYNADPFLKNVDGLSPLDLMVKKGNKVLVDLFLSKGVRRESVLRHKNTLALASDALHRTKRKVRQCIQTVEILSKLISCEFQFTHEKDYDLLRTKLCAVQFNSENNSKEDMEAFEKAKSTLLAQVEKIYPSAKAQRFKTAMAILRTLR